MAVRIKCGCFTPGTAYTTAPIGWEAMDRESKTTQTDYITH